ncbi:iron chelate uptake ABC transporter family permease subunit [Streptococcus ovuberis]|uniref:Iron chelate uptake ABC transporter family permease subunit n=1 Tax=Streptococcus ovuberis TaxID=1936207 RepID=A0A7X6N0A9_9STRE|nr:iron chelate uptake ABC transporter family permease subunit [Streptococcus ovuberis]NKZ21014.1 iron chelate uptake ABC transporter family permease subunit [Streptococcus ovuberis]
MTEETDQLKKRLLVLVALVIVGVCLYCLPLGQSLTAYAVKARGQKLLVYLLVATGIGVSSISFQTITGNRLLTPGVLGLESFYILLLTMFYWFSWRLFGQSILHPLLSFLLLITLQSVFFLLLQPVLSSLSRQGMVRFLLVCMSLGTLFRQLSTFLQVTMDPNEYDQLQARLFPSFQRINRPILGLGAVLLALILILVWKKAAVLDVLHLGRDNAVLLGVDVQREEKWLLWLMVLIVAILTALVGPLTYIGFLASNISYQISQTYRHHYLFIISALVGFLLLLVGQFLVERLFGYRVNSSMVIEWLGGALFFAVIFREGKQ